MTYFQNCKTVEEIKATYRQLARENHPDLGGDTATMQAINAAYERALKCCDGQETTGTDGKVHRYTYNEATERQLMEKFSALLALNLAGIEIALIGTWLWVTGDTKPHKDHFKALDLKWHSKRVCWYFNPLPGRYYSSGGDLSSLARTYGYEKFDGSEKEPKKSKKTIAA